MNEGGAVLQFHAIILNVDARHMHVFLPKRQGKIF